MSDEEPQVIPCADCGSTEEREHPHLCRWCLSTRKAKVEKCRAATAPIKQPRRHESAHVWSSPPPNTKQLMAKARATAEAHIAAALGSM